ncbi:MAG: S-methyl-5-thioribose-1-phosphate isomerase [Sedimentisphaerales bacterium]|nr:S-methyl-5-thioribose-1-phosphate isomerase [Sedimentisphaerales bacterium]
MNVKTLKWLGGIAGCLEIIDQRRLPAELKMLQCTNVKQLYDAIKTLAVRGAPAIGVAGAYGAVLSLKKPPAKASLKQALAILKRDCDYLASSRPTAVNLRWAIDRTVKRANAFVEKHPSCNLSQLRKIVLAEANAIFNEDVQMCLNIGKNGSNFVKNGFSILTHCNAGALATAGQGTALSLLYEAKKQGKRFKVFADESRPLLQGGRLTAWELKQSGIDTTVICDNMAASLMAQGQIDIIIVGADRIAANGDAANKIGTYSLSVLAKAHGIPFYIAAPSSTFDLKTKSGKDIPIEQRPADEVRLIGNKKITPDGIKIYNPAFDVTPAENITAIITEKGVLQKPNSRKIAGIFSF